MTKLTAGIFLFTVILLSACSGNTDEGASPSSAKAPVTVTQITKGTISDSLTFSATVFYLTINKITAPVSGYITQDGFQTGDKVGNGQLLFKLQTREAKALQSVPDSVRQASGLSGLGNINVKAPVHGLLTAVNYVKDDFVQQGTVLATMVSPADIYLKLFIPYEHHSVIKQSDQLKVELPGGRAITATVKRALNQTDSASQSVLWLLKPDHPQLFPEGLKLNIQIASTRRFDTQLLPKEAVLANETLDSFWVMKVVDDTLAIQVPIKKGIETARHVEILSPEFLSSDTIILTGQYGLEDSAAVKIQNPGL